MLVFRAEEGLAPSVNPCSHSLLTTNSITFNLATTPYHVHGHRLLPENLHSFILQTMSPEVTPSLPFQHCALGIHTQSLQTWGEKAIISDFIDKESEA